MVASTAVDSIILRRIIIITIIAVIGDQVVADFGRASSVELLAVRFLAR